MDYCLRAHAAGFRTVAVAETIVYHKFKQPLADPAGVPPYLHYFMTRNYLLLWRKLSRPFLVRKASLWFLYQRLTQIDQMRDVPAAVDAVLAAYGMAFAGRAAPTSQAGQPLGCSRKTLGQYPRFWLALLDGRLPSKRPSL